SCEFVPSVLLEIRHPKLFDGESIQLWTSALMPGPLQITSAPMLAGTSAAALTVADTDPPAVVQLVTAQFDSFQVAPVVQGWPTTNVIGELPKPVRWIQACVTARRLSVAAVPGLPLPSASVVILGWTPVTVT